MTMRLVRDDDLDKPEGFDLLPNNATMLDLAKLATNPANTQHQIEDLNDSVKFLDDHSVRQIVELWNQMNGWQDDQHPATQAAGKMAMIGFYFVFSAYVKEKDGASKGDPNPGDIPT